MGKFGYNVKVDSNHKEIVAGLRKFGAVVTSVHTIKGFTDLVVGYKSKLYLIEIKNGSLIPSKRKLTEGELKCKDEFNSVGVNYHVVENLKEAIDVLTRF